MEWKLSERPYGREPMHRWLQEEVLVLALRIGFNINKSIATLG